MSSQVLPQHHHHHHHHGHGGHGRKRHGKMSRSQTLDRSSQEPASPATKPEVRRCEKHRSPGHAKAKEPAKEVAKEQQQPPPRPEQPPAAGAASGSPAHHRRLAGAGHSAGCRKVTRSQSTCSSGGRATTAPPPSHAHHCHAPVIITQVETESYLAICHEYYFQYKERGDELVAEAESKLSRSLFRAGDVSGGLESLQRAVAQYKMAGDWDTAAATTTRMAELLRKQGDLTGAGRLYGEAGTCYRKHSPSLAVAAYLKSVEMYLEMGKFGVPAKHHEAIALIYSKEVTPADHAAVLHHLSLAAHFYYSDNRNAARNKCRLEMARLHGRLDQYEAALAIYEELGYSALESRLVKYSADEYFFRAGLCHLAIDCLNCQIAIQKYIDYYPAFEVAGECKFLKKLCAEVEAENEEGFDAIVKKNSSIVKLDPWYGAVIGKIRKEIPGELNSLR